MRYVELVSKFRGVGILLGAVILMLLLVVVVATRGCDEDDPVTPAVDAGTPAAWTVDGDVRELVIDSSVGAIALGPATVEAPAGRPDVRWSAEIDDARTLLTGTAEDDRVRFEWRFAEGNPHTVFGGELTLPTADLSQPIVGTVSLPDGEVTYVDASLETVPFAGKPTTLAAMASRSIQWRHGGDVLTLWQWSADRVVLREGEGGGVEIDFHWWNPEHHRFPDECRDALAEVEWIVRPRLTLSFGALPLIASGRHPDGIASALVPIFYDPRDAEDPRFRDGAAASADDFAQRARTISMGHSSPNDARYGNGGLVGLGVGGTIVVPDDYATDDTMTALRTDLGQTTVELVDESELKPGDCAAWKSKLVDSAGVLVGEGVPFEGRFPNLLEPRRRTSTPGFGEFAAIWSPTRLTGHRKDVVRQTLSRTYLDRLVERRGLAVLEIPIVATRNPLIPAAAEALLDAERKGNWTIQEDLARALAEVELLSEAEGFDFVSLGEATRYLRAARSIEIDELESGEFAVHNPLSEPVAGFTLVIDGVVTALVDDEAISQETRAIGGGEEQTWLWWDVPPETTQRLRVESPDVQRAEPIRWAVGE